MTVKKAVPVAKAKPAKAVSVKSALDAYEQISRARFKIAMETYNKQDGLTKEVLDRIRDRITIAATGIVIVNGEPTKLYASTFENNTMFLAVEILGDLALNGIRIANFKPNEDFCLECHAELF